MKLLLTIFGLVLKFGLLAQDIYYRKIDGMPIAGALNQTGITITSDDGYLVYTKTKSQSTNEYHTNVVCMDACDSILWERQYDIMDCYGIEVCSNGFVSVGVDPKSFGMPGYDKGIPLLSQFDHTGNLRSSFRVFDDEYKSSNNYNKISFNEIGSYPDGSFFILGYTENLPIDRRLAVVKFDSHSNVIWSFHYSFISGLTGFRSSAIATTDGGVLIYSIRDKIGITIGVITKIDAFGKVSWSKISSHMISMDSDPLEVENGYIFGATTEGKNIYYGKCYIVKLDFNGNIIWISNQIGSYLPELCITQLANSQLIVIGKVENSTTYLEDSIMVVALTKDGVVQQQAILGLNNQPNISSIDIESIYGNYFLFTGSVMDSSNSSYLFLQKARSLDDLLKCDFIDTVNATKPLNRIILQDVEVTVSPFTIHLEKTDITANNSSFSHTNICKEAIPFSVNIDLGSDTTICKGDSVIISNKYQLNNYIWSNGETLSSISVSNAGLYWLKTGYECNLFTDSIHILNFPIPTLDFSVSPLIATPINKVLLRSESSSVDSVFWFLDAELFSNNHKDSLYLNNNGIHKVVYRIKDVYGCFFEDSTEIEVNFTSVYIPNSFTPNADGINDTFYPLGFGIKSYQIIIYNHLGEMIFNEQNKPWEDTKIINGTYVFQIKITDDFGKSYNEKGKVTVLR